jgi:hypothetical protein
MSPLFPLGCSPCPKAATGTAVRRRRANQQSTNPTPFFNSLPPEQAAAFLQALQRDQPHCHQQEVNHTTNPGEVNFSRVFANQTNFGQQDESNLDSFEVNLDQNFEPFESNMARTTRNSRSAEKVASDVEKENHKNLQDALQVVRDLKDQMEEMKEEQSTLVKKVEMDIPLTSNKDMNRTIKQAVKDGIFRVVKFVANYKDAKSTLFQCLHYIIPPEKLVKMSHAEKDMFATNNAKHFATCISGQRSYVTTGIKGDAFRWLDDPNNGDLPSIELIVKCAYRDIDMNNPEEVKAMEWYWETLLLRSGGATEWTETTKYYNCPGSFKYNYDLNSEEYYLFPPSTEAFNVLVYENNRAKWIAQHAALKKEKAANPNKKVKLDPKNKDNKNEPIYKTLFTESDKGQQQFGGWNQAGKDKFFEYRNNIIARRKEPGPQAGYVAVNPDDNLNDYHAFEKEFLAHLKDKHDKQGDAAQEGRNKKRRKTTPVCTHATFFDPNEE